MFLTFYSLILKDFIKMGQPSFGCQKPQSSRISRRPNERYFLFATMPLRPGIALANLYEILTKKPFGKLEKTRIEVQKIINVNKVLTLFQNDGVTVTASGESVVKGNKKNILSLLWCIFRRYQDLNKNSLFAFFASQRITFSADRVGEEKLAWV
jgi:hypothetical protein